MKFYFRAAAANLLRTYPFLLLRVAVGLALSAVVVLALIATVWIWLTVGTAGGVFAGLAITLFVILFLAVIQPYLLYLVEAGHVAVLTSVIVEDETPASQLSYGLDRVRSEFASVTVLFVIDWVIKQVLRQVNAVINTIVSSLTNAISSTGRSREAGVVAGIVGILQLALNITVSYVDKAILANIYRRDHDNNWESAREGVLLYAGTWKPIFGSALILATVVYGPFIVAGYFSEEILAALGGEEAVIDTIETFLVGLSDVGLVALVIAVLAILTIVHYGVVKPYLTALVLTIYLNETADAEPDGEWEARLRENSPEFRDVERRAEGDADVQEKTGTWRDYFLP